MKQLTTPDAVAARYFALIDRLDLRAACYSETVEVCSTEVSKQRVWHGRISWLEPVYCKGRPGPAAKRVLDHTDSWVGRMRLREWQDVCSDCGKPWQPQEVEVGYAHERGNVKTDACWHRYRLHLLIKPLAALIEPRPRDWLQQHWCQALSLWRVFLRPTVGTYAATARIAQDATSEAIWTRAKVEREIVRARSVVERRMRRRHRLPGSQDRIVAS